MTKKDSNSLHYIFRQLAAGGISCMMISAVLNFNDVIKVRLQTQQQLQGGLAIIDREYKGFFHAGNRIFTEEGVRGLFLKGMTASMLREATYSSLRLGLYEPMKKIATRSDKDHQALWVKILSGACSGAIGSAFTNPIDLVKIRFQGSKIPRYKSTFHAFYRIYVDEGGLKGLYRGATPTIIRASLLTSAQLSSYDHSKHYFIKMKYSNDNVGLHIIASLISGFVTTCITSPVDVIKTRYMNAAPGIFASPLDCLIKTITKDGLTALFKGFVPNYARLGPHFILSLPLYEQLRKLFNIGTI